MQPSAVIRCRFSDLEVRCQERGVAIGDALPCIVERDGDALLVDVSHPSYPHRQTAGPGTELKRLLSRLGIHPAAGCQCLARAAEMDRIGPEACEARLDEIAGWLGEEAKNRGLPFLPAAGRMVVRRAIANARRAAREKAQASDLAHEHRD